MHQLSRKNVHFSIKRRILWRISTLRRYLRTFWRRFFACGLGKSSIKYRHLAPTATVSSSSSSSTYLPSSPKNVVDGGFSSTDDVVRLPRCSLDRARTDSSDLVSLKISLLGDPDIGKSSFLRKYAGGEKGEEEYAVTGINQVDKTLYVKGARISYSIWEVGGDHSSSLDHIPAACKDSVAMLFMFDLTSRCTLNSVIRWYQEARKWNHNAIPVLIGTKFDEFVQLPMDLQWTIASQARSYAKAMNATLFFSSATYNINVNKIFKFLTAKLFNLHWNLDRNLTIGEPIIDF
ncbi:septum-promoting GTP-binding protein 1 [Sesamum indicum]|uniref:Septum-promoting GTP-binding protein 1 n=1 Tax=Sesamum indicum TaxID=4182 RepID=A0A6I9T755_SESIN|nr:septum-promoting GTP-binding protein 1 [Sesamum indicum]